MTLLSVLFIATWTFLAGYQVGSKKPTTNLLPFTTNLVGIEWLGRLPCVSEHGIRNCVYTTLQFGLRKDGVMVWEEYNPCDLPECAGCKGDCVSILCEGCGNKANGTLR